jgi:D-sedoheptulose 7-phosphate isomerase
MQIDIYKSFFNNYFESENFKINFKIALDILSNVEKIFFIGNGGSMSICSHMMQDFAKIANYKTFSFSDPSLITCFSNDFGYENALSEWLKLYIVKNDLLIAISSSGNSMNIINAVTTARKLKAKVVTLSGFKEDNKLRKLGDANFYLPIENYGVVECFHQVILHSLLDEIKMKRK